MAAFGFSRTLFGGFSAEAIYNSARRLTAPADGSMCRRRGLVQKEEIERNKLKRSSDSCAGEREKMPGQF